LKRIGFRNIFIQPWYETDDLAAKIVMERDDRDFIIATRDQDFWQLLSYCDLYDPQTKYLLTEEEFVREWGIHPSKWAEVKSIAGCKSDNVPGIYGVGEKTAVKYITKKLKSHTKKFKDIERNKDIIKRNRRLVTLPFPGTKLYTLQEDQFDFDSFYSICNQLAMDYFLQRRQLNWWRAFFEGYGYDSEPCRTRPRAFA
jgi:5'-3' exonuclease